MTPTTSDLIDRLVANSGAVKRLPAPSRRVAIWLAVSLAYLVALYALWPHPSIANGVDDQFVIQQTAALATALLAAAAAFATVVPGYPRAIALAPLAPLTIWMAHLGYLCVHDASAAASAAPVLLHWGCLPATIVAGIVPTIAMVLMLRRGAPVAPRLSTALGALAVAGLANVGIRFVHAFDPSLVVLTWHVVAVFALSALASSMGRRLLTWPRTSGADAVRP